MSINFSPIKNSLTSSEITTYSNFLPKTKPIKEDIVEISSPNKRRAFDIQKFNRISAIVGMVSSIAYLIYKNRISKVVKISTDIEYKEAKTLQEAITYGQEKLKVNLYMCFEDKDLDIINWINEGLTNCAKKYKSKFRMPKFVNYAQEESSKTIAGVYTNKNSEINGLMTFNKGFFEKIDDEIKDLINSAIKAKTIKQNGSDLELRTDYFSEQFNALLKKYSHNPASLTFKEKMELYGCFDELYRAQKNFLDFPAAQIENMSKMLFGDEEIKIDGHTIEEIYNSTQEEQEYFLRTFLISTNLRTNKNALIYIDKCDSFETIYHEMGHLQDMTPRVKAKGKFENPEEYPQELKDWLKNAQYQKIAGIVSDYAKSGPGEFIAETYAQIISGKYVNSKVMELYRALSGPVIQ